MITLDMIKKQEVRVTDKSFHLENNVLILTIQLPEYDLEGKTITAVFEPSRVETGALEVVDGAIQIPVYSSMVQYGINYIQLNFRWDTTKLEQSPKMMWVIDKSLETEGAAQEDVDIITYLVGIATEAKKDADDLVEVVQGKLDNGEFIGPIGPQGEQGIQGPQGIQGLKGDKGDKGEQGLQGIQGLKGDKGDQGNQGEKGDPGEVTQAEFNNLSQEVTAFKEDYANQRQQDNLKVATVEKGLNDYKSTMANVNVNQEAKQKASGYGVVSLPKNSANGQAGVSVKGRTLKNELNYNRETMSEWIGIGTVTKTVDTLNLPQGSNIASLPTKLKPNVKYGFLYYKANPEVQSLIFTTNTAFDDYAVIHYRVGTIGNLKKVLTTKETITNNRIAIFTSEGAGTEVIKSIRLFELPTGSEIENDFNTLSADQLAIKYPYIKGDSAKSTISASRLKSVGKNLFDKSKAILNKGIDSRNGTLVDSTVNFTSNFIEIEGNTHYILSGWLDFRGFAFYDKNKNFISFIQDNNSTTPSNAKFLRLSTRNVQIDFVKLERGTVATPYEPYLESTQYLPNVGELRSLPNGTKDEIRVSGGKAEYVKRVSEYVLQASDVTQILISEQNMQVVKIPWFSDLIPQTLNTLDGSIVINGYTEKARLYNNITPYTFASHDMYYFTNAIGLVLPLATYPDLTTAKTALTGTKLTYQLAEPIITPIEVSGNLVSYPSGTVYIEKVLPVARIYNNGITVTHTDFPISSLDKISKVDFNTGVETQLDISKSVIASDKKSFTHPDLANGNIVFFEYFYDKESTTPELEIEYYDSRHVLKDSVTGKFYKIVPTVANGVLTNGLGEV